MALIGFSVTLVFLIAIGILVAVNRQAVEVNVWLTQPFEMPLWAVAMLPMIVGALIGLLVGRPPPHARGGPQNPTAAAPTGRRPTRPA